MSRRKKTKPRAAPARPANAQAKQSGLDVRDFVRLVPAKWFGVRRRIFVSCYQTLRTHGDPPAGSTHTVKCVLSLGRLVAYTYDGELRYLAPERPGGLSMHRERGFSVTAGSNSVIRTSGPGMWLIVVQPFYLPEGPWAFVEVRRRAKVAAAACAFLYGRAMAYRHLVDNIVASDDPARPGQMSVTYIHGPYVPLGSHFDEPDIAAVVPDFNSYAASLNRLSNSARRRAELALLWYERSIRQADVTSFLDSWIAIEVALPLAPAGTDPIPEEQANQAGTRVPDAIQRLLAAHYVELVAGQSPGSVAWQRLVAEEAPAADALAVIRSRFGVHRLYRLRNDIVHGGFLGTVEPFVIDYAGLLFRDVFRAVLGMPPAAFAATALFRKTRSAAVWLRGAKDADYVDKLIDVELSARQTMEQHWTPPASSR